MSACACAGRAYAEDAPTRLLAEPTEYTDVIDAFDGDDPFDLNFHLAFTRRAESASIERELDGNVDASGVPRTAHVADSEHVVSSLVLGVDAGLYHDLMVFARVPLVLSDTRKLSAPKDVSFRMPAVLSDGPSGTPLFDANVAARTRSGVPAIDLGAAWGIINQYRKPQLPTWVVSITARIGTGDAMKPCVAGGATCDAGISRGTARVLLDTRWSYRFRYLEPYFGMSYAYEWATSGKDSFVPGGGLPGYTDEQPPQTAEGTLGLSIVPWEDRGRFQRFAIDLRSRATYVSSGREYTPLFDALGASTSPQLTTKNTENIAPGAPASKLVPFTGLTNADAHARLGFEGALVMQAAQYVRFRLGFGLAFDSSHFLTNAAQCDAGARVSSSADPRGGACSPHLWNPLYRAAIDLPGQRFSVSNDLIFDLSAAALGQF